MARRVPVGPGACVVDVVEVCVEITGGGAAVEDVEVVVEELVAGGGLAEVVVVSSLQLPRKMLVASNKINESRNIFFNLLPSSFLTFLLIFSGFQVLLPPYPFTTDKGKIK